MTEHQIFTPASDYETIRAAIAYLSETGADEIDFARFARSLGLNARQLTDLFRRWCGLSPKSFAQAVALDHAKRLLAEQESVLSTTYAVGLSSTSRLHDLFVTYEAMPPGAFRQKGAGLQMVWGTAVSPFGVAVLILTDWGLAGISFADEVSGVPAAFDDLRARWPNAHFVRDDAKIGPVAKRIFDPKRWKADEPVRVVLIGTDFEVEVWETLLGIPMGRATTYQSVAKRIGRPSAARAVGAAVGRNPISFVVPCHRVVGSGGALTGYRWGLPRKRAILGWEAGVVGA
jgi:AraC family transcriptional regulator, regulatory protein of adaptative response / methylated-DNA-[protein]-cysteine methyltransferase